MAEVDFSNARITPLNITNSINPTTGIDLSLSSGVYSSSWANIVTGGSITRLINTGNQLVFLYRGTFTASGTELYVGAGYTNYNYGWKISNISFNSGDTYIFKIRADLICQ